MEVAYWRMIGGYKMCGVMNKGVGDKLKEQLTRKGGFRCKISSPRERGMEGRVNHCCQRHGKPRKFSHVAAFDVVPYSAALWRERSR